MASRKTDVKVLNPVDVFVALQTFEPTETDPVSVVDLADDQKWDHKQTFDALEILADAELVDAEGRGLNTEWFIMVPDVTAENAESVATEALKGVKPSEPVKATKAPKPEAPKKLTAKEQEYKERTAYNAAVSASQEPGAQHLHPQEDTRPTQNEWSEGALKDLDTMAKGEPPVLTDKVDTTSFSLSVDAPQVAAETIERLKRLPEKGLDQFIDAETGDMVYESSIEKNGLKLDEPETVPPVPAGVNANVWDLAHTAITQTARDHWAEVARLDAEAYAANNGQPAPF